MGRRLALLLVLLTLLPAALLRAQIEEIDVPGFRGERQEQSNWCWAASIQSLFVTKGLDVEQAAIVQAAYGRVVNATAPGFEGTLRLLNGVVVDVGGQRWQIHARAGGTYPDAGWLYRRFEQGEPVMIWFRDPYANHSIVLHGGTYYSDRSGAFRGWQSVTAYDPLLDRDMTIAAPNIPRYVYGTFDVSIRRR
jgi:hypothetical protein